MASGRGRYPFTFGPDKSCTIKFAESIRFLPTQKIRTHLSVGQPHAEVLRLFAGPQPTGREEAVRRTLEAFRIIGSPGFAPDLEDLSDRAGRAYDRAYDPLRMARQAVAVLASGDRTERLRSLDVPALVIHGADDRMVDVSGGRATAAAIPSAELVVIDGMGHDLPRPLWPQLAAKIAELVQRRR